jgi:hypothetical protein
MNAERKRLERGHDRALWHRWGPYLSERQWGTVREDYSPYGTAWEYFPHDHARSRAYRWGEDGIGGFCDRYQLLCVATALWNGKDPILKERLFGLTGNEGNHGEDVKEYYYFLDALPSHAYMKMLYRYPQCEFPYARLVEVNRQRTRYDPEFELFDTGTFDDDRFFDVVVEHAKAAPEDIFVRITVTNRGPEGANLTLLPSIWFRNVWSWKAGVAKPLLEEEQAEPPDVKVVRATHERLGTFRFYCEEADELLFTENETNVQRLFGVANSCPYVKDGINDCVVSGDRDAVNPTQRGTKAAARYALHLAPGQSQVVRLRFTDRSVGEPFDGFERAFDDRRAEADEFYRDVSPFPVSDDERMVQRQAFAGLLWSKQFYNYVVHDWLRGDPLQPSPPPQRLHGRNDGWDHFYSDDVLAMPDTWEYPWFAAWDLAFHTVTLALIDPEFAKIQLSLLTREYYMHPNGQIPAYEWAFGDVNPPVQAWAAYRVFQIEQKRTGHGDLFFLERVFQKLLLNFTWWVNRKDVGGRNVFQGGFLGLDNIGMFDRSAPLPGGGRLDQADGTSWMGVFTLNMLRIALELAPQRPVYEDIASKFFEHFLLIADAMNKIGGEDRGLWDDDDGFYYDYLHADGAVIPLRIRSIAGLVPLVAVMTFDGTIRQHLPNFAKRVEWFIANRPDLIENVAAINTGGVGIHRIMSIVDRNQLTRLLRRMLDEAEFLSPYGIRSLSREHAAHPYSLQLDGATYSIDYEPAESTSGLFGGNSNWRGPIWFPLNYLIIESLQKYHYFYGDDFKVEMPTGSGRMMTLWEVSMELSHRLVTIFTRDAEGRRAVFGGNETFQRSPFWRDYVPFYEYFHGDNGAGLGASHQTGWTALVAKLIQQYSEYSGQGKHPFA